MGQSPTAHEHLRGLGEVQASAYNLNGPEGSGGADPIFKFKWRLGAFHYS